MYTYRERDTRTHTHTQRERERAQLHDENNTHTICDAGLQVVGQVTNLSLQLVDLRVIYHNGGLRLAAGHTVQDRYRALLARNGKS